MSTAAITPDMFTRIDNDGNGNPRYVIHFLNLIGDKECDNMDISSKYAFACKRANTIGGKKYHTKKYGGGIVFQSYNISNTIKNILDAIPD